VAAGPPVITERALKDACIDLAKAHGWLVFHALPSINVRGRWATHFQGHAGFPDLVLCHPTGDLLVVELKSEIGRQTPGQKAWLACLEAASVEVDLWRPEQLKNGTIVRRLGKPNRKN